VVRDLQAAAERAGEDLKSQTRPLKD
jgi:hypothetical protein